MKQTKRPFHLPHRGQDPSSRGLSLRAPVLDVPASPAPARFFYYWLLLILGLFSSYACFYNALGVPVNRTAVLLCLILFPCLFTAALLVTRPALRRVLLLSPLSLGLIALFLPWNGRPQALAEDIARGLIYTVNGVISAYMEKTNFDFQTLSAPPAGLAEITFCNSLFTAVLLLIFSFLMAWSLIRVGSGLLCCLPTAVFVATPLAYTIVPHYGLAAMYLVFLALLLLGGPVLRSKPRFLRRVYVPAESRGTQKTRVSAAHPAAFLVLPALFLCLLFIVLQFPPGDFQRSVLVNDLRNGFANGAGLPTLFRSGGVAGNTNRVNLQYAGSIRFTGKTVLRVQSPRGQAFYLKGFVGSVYTGRSWETLPEQAGQELAQRFPEGHIQTAPSRFAQLFGEKFRGDSYDNSFGYTDDAYVLSIQNVGGNPRCIYMPYGLLAGTDNTTDHKPVDDGFLKSAFPLLGTRNYSLLGLRFAPFLPFTDFFHYLDIIFCEIPAGYEYRRGTATDGVENGPAGTPWPVSEDGGETRDIIATGTEDGDIIATAENGDVIFTDPAIMFNSGGLADSWYSVVEDDGTESYIAPLYTHDRTRTLTQYVNGKLIAYNLEYDSRLEWVFTTFSSFRQMDVWKMSEWQNRSLNEEQAAFAAEMKDYTDFVYAYYTQLPAGLKTELDQFRRSYDLDKKHFPTAGILARAIIDQVQGQNAYTLSPGPTPEDEDFVSWFLFESHKGYCMHFASAVVALLRSAGIPARYAEGYTVSPSDPRDTEGWASIPDSRAHAWAEIYVSGIGWIPLEATPGVENGVVNHAAATSATQSHGAAPTQPQTEEEAIPEDQAEERPEETSQGAVSPGATTATEGGKDSAGSHGGLPQSLLRVLGVLVVVALLILALLYLRRLRLNMRKILFTQQNPNTAAIHIYRYILLLLSHENRASGRVRVMDKTDKTEETGKTSDETEAEASAADALPAPLQELILKARFSRQGLTTVELETLTEYAEQTTDRLWRSSSPLRRFLQKYVYWLY